MHINGPRLKAAQSVTFDLLILKIFFLFFKNTVKNSNSGKHFTGTRTGLYELRHEISNNVACATSKGSDQPAHTRSLIRAFASRLNIL